MSLRLPILLLLLLTLLLMTFEATRGLREHFLACFSMVEKTEKGVLQNLQEKDGWKEENKEE